LKKLRFFAKDNLKVLILSDLHIYTKREIAIIKEFFDKLKGNNYDCIFVVGDIVDSISVLNSEMIKNEIYNLFMYFASFAHIYFVTGNHDMMNLEKAKYKNMNVDDLKTFYDELSEIKNVDFLKNQTIDISNHFTVSGIYFDEAYYSLRNCKNNLDENSLSFLKELSKEKTNILLCHYPNVIMELYEKNCLQNVDFGISGHNHNGMTQFKFLPIESFFNLIGQKNRGLITPSKSIRLRDTAKLRGIVDFDDKTKLIINPAFKSLSVQSKLEVFDWMFYDGYTEIIFEKKK